MGEFWWTVDEDMFTYVMKIRIEELIEEKLNQEFLSEVETRENEDFDSEEEMTSETEETDDDSEPNNENVNNYLDSANMATNLESAMKLACRILGFTTFNSLLQYINRLVWENSSNLEFQEFRNSCFIAHSVWVAILIKP